MIPGVGQEDCKMILKYLVSKTIDVCAQRMTGASNRTQVPSWSSHCLEHQNNEKKL